MSDDEVPEWESRMAVPTEDDEMNVERARWSEDAGNFYLEVRFKRLLTDEEIEEQPSHLDRNYETFSDEWNVASLLREHPDFEGTALLRKRRDLTNEVVQMALERALWVQCSSQYDPENVAIVSATVEEREKVREVVGVDGHEDSWSNFQPHVEGEMSDEWEEDE